MSLKLFENLFPQNSNVLDFAQSLFSSSDSYLFLNQALPQARKNEIFQQLRLYNQKSGFITHPSFLIPSSGTTSVELKVVVISKNNFLNAARRANQFLNSEPQNSWLLSLPVHHVAGLSIVARAYLNKNEIYFLPSWDIHEFVQLVNKNGISFCSLVPTQVFDLVSGNIQAPKSLRHVLVGGSSLTAAHFLKMQQLGWPIIKTFGMTETSAFFSVAGSDSMYRPLPGVNLELDSENRLAIQSDSLFEGYILQSGTSWSYENKVLNNGYWSTEDLVRLMVTSDSSQAFELLGRTQSLIKIKGEMVNLNLLNERLNEIATQKKALPTLYLNHMSGGRDENELFVVVPSSFDVIELKKIIAHFNSHVLPFERITWYLPVSNLPMTEIGKFKLGTFKTDEFKESYFENRKSILD